MTIVSPTSSLFPSIIFLEYDGVLHPDAIVRESRQVVLKREGYVLFEWAPLLEDALAHHPDIRIVLSTNWVRLLSYDEAKKQLPASLQERIVGTIYPSKPVECPYGKWAGLDPFSQMSRYMQVMSYVHRHDIKYWLAIDDDFLAWTNDELHHLVITDWEFGLAEPGKLSELKRRLAALTVKRNTRELGNWMVNRRVTQKKADELLGYDASDYLFTHGKLYDAGEWSGHCLSSLMCSTEGCAFVLQLLTELEGGVAVNVVIQHDQAMATVPSYLTKLGFKDGRLCETRGDEVSIPVDLL